MYSGSPIITLSKAEIKEISSLPPASAVEVIESEPSSRLSVCVCVSALSRPNRLTYDLAFGMGVDLDLS